jgi:hypothetical protein
MSEIHQADSQPGVASMVGGILVDAQKLCRQEIALARREVAQAWDKGKTAVALLASALAVFGAAEVLLGVMLAKLLYQYFLPNHEWACFGIAGILAALLCGALVYLGLQKINEIHMSLPQTAETLRQDVQAVSDAVSGNGTSTHPLLKR